MFLHNDINSHISNEFQKCRRTNNCTCSSKLYRTSNHFEWKIKQDATLNLRADIAGNVIYLSSLVSRSTPNNFFIVLLL